MEYNTDLVRCTYVFKNTHMHTPIYVYTHYILYLIIYTYNMYSIYIYTTYIYLERERGHEFDRE